jgi:hypothetical protein
LKPPQEIPIIPHDPVHHFCAAIRCKTSSASYCSCLRYSPRISSRTAHVNAHAGVTTASNVWHVSRITFGCHVAFAVRQVL